MSVDVQSLTNRDGSELSQLSDLKQSTHDSKIQMHSFPQSDLKSATSIMTKNKDRAVEVVPTTDRHNNPPKNDITIKATTDRTDITPEALQKL